MPVTLSDRVIDATRPGVEPGLLLDAIMAKAEGDRLAIVR